jgi:hypothetical protein
MAFVVRHPNGRPMDPDAWTADHLPDVIARAGLSPEAAGLTLHGLRHTFGSHLLAGGEPAKYVSEQMGHASVAFTQDVYQHVLAATRARGGDTIDRLMRMAATPPVAPAPPAAATVGARARTLGIRLVPGRPGGSHGAV